jgi:cytochrome bd-type quinol oxidase subunit 2
MQSPKFRAGYALQITEKVYTQIPSSYPYLCTILVLCSMIFRPLLIHCVKKERKDILTLVLSYKWIYKLASLILSVCFA